MTELEPPPAPKKSPAPAAPHATAALAALARGIARESARLKPGDRAPATLAHLLSLPPLWGVIFVMGVMHYYRESSRAVAFQARQAIYLHMAFLAAGVGGMAVRLAATLFNTAFPWLNLGWLIGLFQRDAALGLYYAYCAAALSLALFSFLGRTIVLPVVGPKLLESELAQETEADSVYG